MFVVPRSAGRNICIPLIRCFRRELGGVSIYGLGRLPGTLYYEQRIRLLD
jgi:hypothetical protein